jgi:hypothetical protein
MFASVAESMQQALLGRNFFGQKIRIGEIKEM